MKKCSIHNEADATFKCAACGRSMCAQCKNISGSICPRCALKEKNIEYAKTADSINQAVGRRNIVLAALLLSIVLVAVALFVAALRPFWLAFFALAALPVMFYTIKPTFNAISSFAAAEGEGLSQKLFAGTLTIFYALATLSMGMMSAATYVVFSTLKTRIKIISNDMILASYLQELPSSSPYIFLG